LVLEQQQVISHLIGKGGCVVNKIQEDTGTMLKYQPEADMAATALGRLLEVVGPAQQQAHALYLICRKVSQWPHPPPLTSPRPHSQPCRLANKQRRALAQHSVTSPRPECSITV
jgi:hypothetical protein